MPYDGATFNFAVIRNIAKQKLLLSLLLVSLLTTIVFPLRSYFVVLPFFSEKLLHYSKEEAGKTANYLSSEILHVENGHLLISDNVEAQMKIAAERFGLEKIKIFSETGGVIYSTNNNDVGSINDHDYFHLRVKKGETFAKIVSKDHDTLEGVRSTTDVAEIYIPVMVDEVFRGAFELYYDLTKRKTELDNLLWKEALFGFVVSVFMLGIVCIILIRASRASMMQETAERNLRTMNLHLETIVKDKTRELRLTQEASIYSLAILAENYDPNTGEHINRIRRLTQLLVNHLQVESTYSAYIQRQKNYAEDLAIASILHDIGKTSLPNEILAKPGKLTDDEFELVKKHTVVAGNVLSQGNELFVQQFGKDSYLALAADIAMYHHEKWDGSGYPKGLQGQDIPLSARIVAIADVYDALRSDRPYKKAWSHEKTVELILSESGKHFDPELVRIFALNVEQFRQVSDEY
jgi:HD-GYP domain-containing protein (c-di-GMP phosphodiesterase class II)